MRAAPLIHLVYPRIGGRGLHETNGFRYRPHVLFVLGAIARRCGWRVRIIDENCAGMEPPPGERPDLAAITCWTRFAPRVYEICAEYRSQGVPTVVGGVHPSIAVNEALRYADAVVAGEAESVLGSVLEDVLDGTLQPLYRGEWLDMDRVPHVREYSDLMAHRAYRWSPLQTYQSTRGCRFNCDFCSVIRINGRRQRHVDPERVVEELELLTHQPPRLPGGTSVYLLDDDIAADREYLAAFCEALIKADLPITWGAQASIGIARDPELIALAARAGMDAVFIGFESMSRESLLEANKKNRPHEYAELIERVHQHGITVRGGIVLGFDNEGPDTFRTSAEMAHEVGMDVVHFTILTPLPGTQLFARLHDEGRIVDYNWAHYDIYHPVFEPARMSIDQLADGLITSYQTFYGRSRQLQRFARSLRRQRLRAAAVVSMNNALFARAFRDRVPSSPLDFQAHPDDIELIAAASRVEANDAIDEAIRLSGRAPTTPVQLVAPTRRRTATSGPGAAPDDPAIPSPVPTADAS